jgi:lysine-N-methylase
MQQIKQYNYLTKFKCLGDKCPDNCCYGWSIGVDQETYEIYEKNAPELIDFIEKDDEGCYMKKDPSGSGNCIKLENGLCGIHGQYGADYLSKTCFNYPRLVKKTGETLMVGAELSCPEITKLCLFEDGAFNIDDGHLERIYSYYDYLPEGENLEKFLSINKKFINYTEQENLSAEHIMFGIVKICEKLEKIDQGLWPAHINELYKQANKNKTVPVYDVEHPFKLLEIVLTMLNKASKTRRKRLEQALDMIITTLKVEIDHENVKVIPSTESLSIYNNLYSKWKSHLNNKPSQVLKRYLQAELALSLFPYGGQGGLPYEKALFLSFKFMFIRLALICHIEGEVFPFDEDTTVKIVQGVLRYLSHTQEIKLPLTLFNDFGWLEEGKFKAIIYGP